MQKTHGGVHRLRQDGVEGGQGLHVDGLPRVAQVGRHCSDVATDAVLRS